MTTEYTEEIDVGLALKRGALFHARGATLIESLDVMEKHARFPRVVACLQDLRREYAADMKISQALKTHEYLLSPSVARLLEIGFVAGIFYQAMNTSADLLLIHTDATLEILVNPQDLKLLSYLSRVSALIRFGVPLASLSAILDREVIEPAVKKLADHLLRGINSGEFPEDGIVDQISTLSAKVGITNKRGFARPDDHDEGDFRFQRWIFYRRILDELLEGKSLPEAIREITDETEEMRLHRAAKFISERYPDLSISEAMVRQPDTVFTREEVMLLDLAERSNDAIGAIQALLEIMSLEFIHGYYLAKGVGDEYVRPARPSLSVVK